MREILGYAPIEPDGSVRVRIPANVAFVISVLDANGRRLTPQFATHRAWLQLRPGETRQCNGCHRTTNPDRSHGRDGASDPVWSGGSGAGPFPGTRAEFAPLAGETMAQARARATCLGGSLCSEILSMDVKYEDVWTDAASAGRAPDAPLSYTYGGANGLPASLPPPISQNCITTWMSTCRTVINYVQNIHPLWAMDRGANTCINCHTRNAMGQTQVPAGQLELTDGDSEVEPLHLNAYHELLYGDNAQEVIMGALQDITITTTDPVTGEIISTELVPVPAPLSAGNARGSRFFNGVFAPGGSHAGWLTPAELRLLSEWVDIGAQYYNDPFAIPAQ
jgi:hypothetical protein